MKPITLSIASLALSLTAVAASGFIAHRVSTLEVRVSSLESFRLNSMTRQYHEDVQRFSTEAMGLAIKLQAANEKAHS